MNRGAQIVALHDMRARASGELEVVQHPGNCICAP
jgi:hypothetical protein